MCVALENETSFFVSDVSETPTHRIAFRSVATASDDADDGARWYKYRRASVAVVARHGRRDGRVGVGVVFGVRRERVEKDDGDEPIGPRRVDDGCG